MSETLTSTAPLQRRRPGGRRRWTATDKSHYLAAFAKSGLSIKAFCAEMDVPRATFTLWQQQARSAAGTVAAPTAPNAVLVRPSRSSGASHVERDHAGAAHGAWRRRGACWLGCEEYADAGAQPAAATAAMIGLAGGRAIFLATGVTDLRRGVSGLYAMILEQLRGEPLSGAVFAFCNRRRDTVKLFCYDAGGVWLCAKRLEQGTYRWPAPGERTVRLTETDLTLLLSGIDPARTRLRRWWQPMAPSAEVSLAR